MARLAAILKAVASLVWRDFRKLNSVTGNVFFLWAILLPQAGAFLFVVLGLLLLFPLCNDPWRKIPRDRVLLWPLTPRSLLLLRVGCLGLSPPVWIILALLAVARSASLAWRFLLLSLGIYALSSLAEHLEPRCNFLHAIPATSGRLGQLIRKNLRQMLVLLDFYLAAVLCVAGTIYRFVARNREPDALMVMTLIIVVALATCTHNLFGLDTTAGFTRYRLLPLAGWRILLAKDLAFLIVLLAVTLPLEPLTALSAGWTALAIGHHPSVIRPRPQARWRFSGGASLIPALIQVILLFSAGVATFRSSALFAIPSAAGWLVSLWWCGRRWDRM